jgi:carbon storage regulator
VLVLSRRKNERLILGNGLVTLTVVDIRGDKVRLGVTAPTEMPVHREEIQNLIDGGRHDDQRE